MCRHDDNITIVIHQEAKDILFDSEVIRDDPESLRLAVRLRLTHRFLPWGSREFNGAQVPSVLLIGGDPTGQLLSRHRWQGARFGD